MAPVTTNDALVEKVKAQRFTLKRFNDAFPLSLEKGMLMYNPGFELEDQDVIDQDGTTVRANAFVRSEKPIIEVVFSAAPFNPETSELIFGRRVANTSTVSNISTDLVVGAPPAGANKTIIVPAAAVGKVGYGMAANTALASVLDDTTGLSVPLTRQNAGGSGAAGTATINAGEVASVAVSSGGTGYTTAPTVSFVGGGGTGATGTATVNAGAVTAVTISSGGTGYTSAPSVVFTPAVPDLTSANLSFFQGTDMSLGLSPDLAGATVTLVGPLTAVVATNLTDTLVGLYSLYAEVISTTGRIGTFYCPQAQPGLNANWNPSENSLTLQFRPLKVAGRRRYVDFQWLNRTR